MNASLALAQEQVREVVRELKAVRFCLLGVKASLPAAAAETDRLGDFEQMDPVSKLRSDIDCVLRDALGPAIRALEAAADSADRVPGEPSDRQEDDHG